MLIRLTTLGAVRVHAGDIEIADLPAQRLRFGLLVYLAVERDVSREEVLALFWPERDTARGRHALRQMLYELRQVLGDDWIDVRRDRIVVDVAVVDAAAFETAAAEGRSADALDLYGGPFLAGFSLDNRSFEGWADRRRAHLGRIYRRVQREHIAQLVERGHTDAALAAARRWVELDPLEDEAAHILIGRLAAAGQRTAALQYYDNYERQLAAELQVEPLEETKALVAAIRSGDNAPTAPLATPPARPDDPVPIAAVTHDATPKPPGRVAIRHVRTTPRRALAAAAVLASLILIIALVLWPPPRVSMSANRSVRIAVLPFADHSPDAALDPLTNTLTATLAHSLAQSRFLDIISPNGVVLLRSQGTPEDSLGRLLGADYLVGGSVSRDGDRIRVDVELLDGRTGTVVRTEIVERPWAESRILVEDVVQGAALFLRREVGAQVEIERGQAQTTNEDAWRLVLEAKALQASLATLLKARQFAAVQRDLARSDSVLELAAALDRSWAEPVVMRGWALERRAFVARVAAPAETEERRRLLHAALVMSERARERDPANAGAYELRGALLYQLALLGSADSVFDRLAQAENALGRATRLDPLNQSSWRRLAELLHYGGRYGEAKVAAERAYRLDPYAPETNTLVNLLFATSFEMGEDDTAEGWCLEGRRRYPAELPFLYCLLALHGWADGIRADPALMHRAMRSFQQSHLRIQPQLMARFETMIAAAHARAGQPDSARALLRRIAGVSGDPALLWMRAGAHSALGEDSVAIALLRAYLERGSWEAARVARSRPFWRLRDQAALQRLIRSGPSAR